MKDILEASLLTVTKLRETTTSEPSRAVPMVLGRAHKVHFPAIHDAAESLQPKTDVSEDSSKKDCSGAHMEFKHERVVAIKNWHVLQNQKQKT